MTLKNLVGLPKKTIEEKITNRILINIGYTILGYMILYMFYQYGMGSIGDILSYKYVMCGIFVAFAVFAIALYALSFSKNTKIQKYNSGLRNYGHMLLAISIAAFYVNLPFYTQWIPIESTSGLMRSMLMFLKNTRFEYYVVAFAMLVYILIAIIYNTFMLKKITKKSVGKASK